LFLYELQGRNAYEVETYNGCPRRRYQSHIEYIH